MPFLGAQADVRLKQLGYSNDMTAEAKREAEWWLRARAGALARRAPLLSGWAVIWRNPRTAELVPFEEPAAGQGEVTIEVVTSVVSSGTERAQYLRLPNANVFYPHRPGYCAAGVVVAVGRGVAHVSPGDSVATSGVPHVSVATVAADAVYKLPPGGRIEEAAVTHLGIIAAQGVRRAGLEPGEPVCVIGAGLVGALALRLAVAAGAGPVTVLARSRTKEHVAREGGASGFLATGTDDDTINALSSPVVIEATGDPEAVKVAVAAAGPGGRVVLLGSPRGTTMDLPLASIRVKRLRIVGAHVNTLAEEGRLSGTDLRRAEAEAFLEMLGDGRVSIGGLLDELIDPREAGAFYRRLATSTDLVGARFDWTRLPHEERLKPGRFLRLPDLSGRGVEEERAPLPPAPGRRRPAPRLLEFEDDIFRGATGQLRFGMLGCGDVALQNAAALAAAPNTSLVACYDPATSLADDVAGAHGATTSPTAEALLDRKDVDAVFVSVPHHLHAPLVKEAAGQGKHVIVEKPLANNLTAARDMVDVAERAGVVLSVCFPYRYQPDVMAARRLIEAGALGEFGGALLTVCDDKPPSYWLGGFSGRSQSNWRGSREKSGGGALIMNLSHYVDVLRYLVGVEADHLVAIAAAVDEPAEVEDTVSVTVRYSNGAVASLFGCSAVRGGRSVHMRLWGHNGQIAVGSEPRVYTLHATDGLRTTRWQTFGRLPSTSMRAAYVSRFATAVTEGRPPDVTAGDGLAVQALIEAAYQSSELGSTVRPADLLSEITV
jgi:2-desacetyl-2-hydroxyethyl bacteriochlorophyllide A dehydrogenase